MECKQFCVREITYNKVLFRNDNQLVYNILGEVDDIFNIGYDSQLTPELWKTLKDKIIQNSSSSKKEFVQAKYDKFIKWNTQ